MITNEKALEILEDGRNPYNTIDTDKWCEAFEMAIEALKKQRAKGHWINAKVGKLFPSNDFKCSECGNILDFNGVNCSRGYANYCPNCGADMRCGRWTS